MLDERVNDLADSTGEVGVVLFNHSDTPYDIQIGDRIAQLILEKIATPPGILSSLSVLSLS